MWMRFPKQASLQSARTAPSRPLKECSKNLRHLFFACCQMNGVEKFADQKKPAPPEKLSCLLRAETLKE